MKNRLKPQGMMAAGLLAALLLSGCSTTPDSANKLEQANYQTNAHKLASNKASQNMDLAPELDARTQFQQLFNSWSGVPYRFGGNSKRGIDCSALMQVSMQRLFDMNLPRTTALQVKQGHYIDRKDAKFGDLIFFRTGRNTRHVGLYIGEGKFMHASSSRGVMISRTDNPYWASKFWQFRRYEGVQQSLNPTQNFNRLQTVSTNG